MIILDIDMPKRCKECSLRASDDFRDDFCIVNGWWSDEGRPDDCPIVGEIPENPTNGDVIKAMYSNARFYEDRCGYGYVYSDDVACKENYMMTFSKDWWNAPYKRGKENDS